MASGNASVDQANGSDWSKILRANQIRRLITGTENFQHGGAGARISL